jgi:hypothetical protein
LDARDKLGADSILQLPSAECRRVLSDVALQRMCESTVVCAVCDEYVIDITRDPAKWYARERFPSITDLLSNTAGNWHPKLIEQYTAHPTVRSAVVSVRWMCSD